LTRDIISPVKHSVAGLSALIKTYEREEMEEKVYPLIPVSWHQELRLFTEDEFTSIAYVDGERVMASTDEIDRAYNTDAFNARDGELTKAVDDLAAYMEVYLARENGITSPEMNNAGKSIKAKYGKKAVGRTDFARLYATL
jgi:putative hydrolase of HD superfamily